MQPPLWPQLLLQVILIAINAYFAATEIAVISLNEAVIRHQAEEGDKKAARLLHIVEQPTGFLSTIQIGITLAGFLGSAFAADNLAGRLSQWFAAQYALTAAAEAAVHTLSVILITIVLSFFTLVFGELVPKRVAMKKSEQVARFTCGVVAFLAAVMRPLIWLLTVSTNAVLRLVHIDPNEEDDEVSEEGIRMMVDIGEEKGAIQAGEKEMIENIFEFDNMTAGDVMIHRTDMVMLWVDDTAEEIAQTIESSGLSRFPVYEEDADDIIGILNTRDWLLNARKASPRPVRELLRPAYFVPESVRTDKLFRDMQSRKIHLSIVVDEYGGTAGLVTMEDLLEEIVGNIYDEFDPQEDQEIHRPGRQPLAHCRLGGAGRRGGGPGHGISRGRGVRDSGRPSLCPAQRDPGGRQSPRGGAVRPAHPGGGADRPPGRVGHRHQAGPLRAEGERRIGNKRAPWNPNGIPGGSFIAL